MPESLTSGVSGKSGRVIKLLSILKGAKVQYQSGATLQVDNGATLLILPQANPATCTKGALSVDAAGKLQVCSATNTWTTVGTQV